MFDMSLSEFTDQQADVLRNQKAHDRRISLTQKEYRDMERDMQWPEDLAAYDRLNAPMNMAAVGMGQDTAFAIPAKGE